MTIALSTTDGQLPYREELIRHAYHYIELGYVPIPTGLVTLDAEGRKQFRPLISWKATKLRTREEFDAWLQAEGREFGGLAWDCGASGVLADDLDTYKPGFDPTGVSAPAGALVQTTANGGLHTITRNVTGARNAARATAVDTRGEGGLLLVAPTRVPGARVGVYRWAAGLESVPLATALPANATPTPGATAPARPYGEPTWISDASAWSRVATQQDEMLGVRQGYGLHSAIAAWAPNALRYRYALGDDAATAEAHVWEVLATHPDYGNDWPSIPGALRWAHEQANSEPWHMYREWFGLNSPAAVVVPASTNGAEASAAQPRQSSLWGSVLSQEVLKGDLPPVAPYVLEGLVREGELAALVSKAKAGKSLLTLELVLQAVAAGRRVVYLDAENTLRDLLTRIHALGHAETDTSGLTYISFPSLTLDDPAGARELLTFVAELSAGSRYPDLVVLDTASRFLTGDENDAGPWLAMYREALLPLKRVGVAVLRLDHLGKDTTRGARGSSAKNGDVDAVFELEASDPDRLERVMVELTCTMQRSGTHERWVQLVRAKVDGVLGHRRPGIHLSEHGAPVIIGAPEDIVDQIVRALDEISAPVGTGRARARELVGDQFSKVGSDTWMKAVRRRKERGAFGDGAYSGDLTGVIAGRSHEQDHGNLPGAEQGRQDVSADQTCPGQVPGSTSPASEVPAARAPISRSGQVPGQPQIGGFAPQLPVFPPGRATR